MLPCRSRYLSGPSTEITNITLQARCPLDFSDHLLIIYEHHALQWVGRALLRDGPASQPFGHSAYETPASPRSTPALSASPLKGQVQCVGQKVALALPYPRSSGGLA